MCGRYSLTVEADVWAERFGCSAAVPLSSPRYNVAPSQNMPVIIDAGGCNRAVMMRWGLIPFWAKNLDMGNKLINARLESVAEKPAFKYAVMHRRCIILADGYYEWQKMKDGKQPMRIVAPYHQLFGFAGLWEKWNKPDGKPVFSYTIITTTPVPAVAQVHYRMPLILRREQEEYWLRGLNEVDSEKVNAFLFQIRPLEEIQAYQVSKKVNSPQNDNPACIEPI